MATPPLMLPKHGLHYLGGFTLAFVLCALLSWINVSIILVALFVMAFYYIAEKYAYQGGKLACQEGKFTVVNPFAKDKVEGQ